MSSEALPRRLFAHDREIELRGEETVLEALERAGIDAMSGCRNGVCAKCLLQSDDPPPGSQRGLRPTLRAQGYFYSCQAVPTADLVLRSAPAPARISATVREVRAVAPDVAVVLLEPSGDLPFRPGQYLDVFHPSGPSRSYSIASLPAWGLLELHVRRIPDGLLSTWLHGLEAGAQLEVRGAFGQCFYTPDEEGKRPDKLLLVGAGTGLAPLLGIARDAVAQGYGGQIDLVHGGLEPSRLYLRDELRAFERQAAALTVHHCVLHGATSDEISGSLEDVAAAVGAPLGKSRAFLCGDEGIVRVLQRSLFLAGVPSGEILADPFSPASTG